MTAEQRNERIALLRRQEDRKRRLPVLLAELSIIANCQFTEDDLLTIEKIDQHQRQMNGSDFNFNFLNLSFPADKVKELYDLLLTLREPLSQINYFALSQFSEIAVFDIKTDFVIDKFEDIIKFDKNTFTICDHDYKNGLWIDVFQEYWYLDERVQFIWIYELRIFGKDWIKLINEKL